MSGGFMLRMLVALCAALALVVSLGLGSAAAQSGSEDGAPSICAQRRLQPVIDHALAAGPPDALRPETPARAQIRRGQAARSRAKRGEQRPGEAGRELDCIGNVRRLRGGARYGAGAPLPSDLGGYKYTAFGRTLAADAGTPAPVVDGVGFEQALRWQGRWIDTATGLYDVRNRQWSPELGAFLSPDEFEYFRANGTMWSWPGQNPLRHRDPSGNDTFGRAVAGGFGAFLGAQVGFSLGGGSGLVVGAAEGGVPAVATAPAGALVGAGEGFLLGGALGIAIYDLSQTAGASIWDVLDGPLLAQRGKGNVADTGIAERARKLVDLGLAADICEALAKLMSDAGSIADSCEQSAEKEKIKATQKAFDCRHSRQSK